ncbi:MAG TPA: aldo/keto reductase [Verrucomicrobiae bacterium]|nr:aldo/keto reductase [Verrucomicrobiae bacterium]
MAAPDSLRDARIPLTHGSGAIPALGFGTLIPDPLVTQQATKTALETGFRHLYCSERYRNEQAVGDAMQAVFKAGRIQRKDVFVTTKVWNNNHRPERVKPAFEASRRRLQLDDVDCYLIHTPFAFQPGDEQDPRDEHGQVIYDSGVTLVETWQALERLVDEGQCKAIGLSNVNLEKLKEIVDAARIKPAVVEIESHPYLPEWELLDYCRQHGIVLLAFAALGHGMKPGLLDDPVIIAIAKRLGKTPAQIVLAWAIQRGTALLTTAVTPGRIQENFELSAIPEDAMQEIRDQVTTRIRLNTVVETGVPGFIPRNR